ncbi:MAG: LysM peptidoglycan-binding domain-containing protein [Candidatus Pristimantibacillus lignocellulolyticus]|uniref:LysM peptidoglycan-binding domain-containing protein n=1 Tax=Candidatus Pristimantibacillus lignocellulolyticus TaxID=2994561 RepID=A0A9J6ZA50_9BACL|nr:MAG: LysM peptidoglycan-binding domain-containing protein [Candidatus Pristimantibacillus lignocellulolyticus]
MRIHIVKQDDSIFHLAQKYHVTVDELLKQNSNIIDPYNLEIGSKLRIPSMSSAMVRSDRSGGMQMEIIHQHVVTSGDSMWKLSQEWGVSLADLIAVNKHIHNPNVLQIGDIINIPKKASMGASQQVTAQATSTTPISSTPEVSVTLPSVPSLLHHLLPGFQLHTVVSGDSLYKISKKYGVSLDDILALNPNITNPNQLSIGMKVLIPKGATSPSDIPVVDITTTQKYIVQSGDTLWKLANTWNIPLKELVAANKQLSNPNALQVGDIINIPKSYSVDLSGQIHAQQLNGMSANQKAANQQMINSKKANNQIMPTQAVQPKQPTPIQISPTINVAPTINVTKAAPIQKVVAAQVKPTVTAKTVAPIKTKTEPVATAKVEPLSTKVSPVANANAKVESMVTKVSPVANANANAKVESVVQKVSPVANANANAKVESMVTKVSPVANANANAKVESMVTKVSPVANANANAKVESMVTKVSPVANANANAKVESVVQKVSPVANANANAKVESVVQKVSPANANANAKVESVMTKVSPVANANANAKVESVMTKVSPVANANANAKVESMATKMMPMANSKIEPMATKMMPMANSKIEPMATKMMPVANSKIEPMATKMMPMANSKIEPMATKMMPVANSKIEPYATKMMPTANSKIEPYATKMMPVANSKIEPYATKMMPVANSKIEPMATKMMPVANKGYAGFKPLPADLEQHPYFPNAEMLHQYQSPNSGNQANMGKFKPMINSNYKVPVSPYSAYAPMQYYNPCGCPTYPNQGNWGGYTQPMNYSNNMNPSGGTIMAQSAMYPPMSYGANVQGYANPWNTDCGCGGTPQPYAEGVANKASKLGPVTKVKKVGKRVNIQAAKKTPKRPKGGRPWLNV